MNTFEKIEALDNSEDNVQFYNKMDDIRSANGWSAADVVLSLADLAYSTPSGNIAKDLHMEELIEHDHISGLDDEVLKQALIDSLHLVYILPYLILVGNQSYTKRLFCDRLLLNVAEDIDQEQENMHDLAAEITRLYYDVIEDKESSIGLSEGLKEFIIKRYNDNVGDNEIDLDYPVGANEIFPMVYGLMTFLTSSFQTVHRETLYVLDKYEIYEEISGAVEIMNGRV